jgi:hypothetical protein
MVSNKRSTATTKTQQSNLDWNAPQERSTPRGEYFRMMADYSPVWGITASNFGPVNGGVAQ